MKKIHYHSCTECYDHFPCDLECTIEYDLSEEDKEFGSHCQCPTCHNINDGESETLQSLMECW